MVSSKREIVPGDCVLVTGAAGGVGSHVVKALIDAGCEVKAVDLRPMTHAGLDEEIDEDSVEWIEADLTKTDLRALVKGCDAVIHAAALVGLSEKYDDMVEVNVDLVHELLEASEAEGVRHFIHFSTGAIYRPGRGLLGEEAAIEPSSDYAETKLDAEAAFTSDLKLNWTILRPALLYGPRCESMSAGLFTLPPILRNFMPLMPGFTGGARSNWCHADDAASAALFVLGNPKAYSRVFNVADDTPMGSGEVITAITEAYGLPIGPLVPFPNSTVLLAFSPVMDRDYLERTLRTVLRQIWKRVVSRHELETPLRPKVDRGALFYVAEDTVLDAGALKELGWDPAWPSFRDGVVDTLRWYQDQGWAPKFDAEQRDREDTSFGFAVSQTLSGKWVLPATGESRPAQVSLEAEFPNIVKADFHGRINGMAWIEGLAQNVAIEGTAKVEIFSGRNLTYEFAFVSDEGVAHRCRVEATFNPFRVFSSMSNLNGTMVNAQGEKVGNVEFSLGFADQLVPMLMSFRPLT
jgi:dTDP-glucose 4,6-dehydratase